VEGYINLTEEGAVTQAGRAADTVADEHDAQSRRHLSQIEGTEPGMRGRGGNMFRSAGELSFGNAQELGRRYAERAVAAVLGEDALIESDVNAGSDQQATLTAFDSESVTLRREI
jgi:hypothetical protein